MKNIVFENIVFQNYIYLFLISLFTYFNMLFLIAKYKFDNNNISRSPIKTLLNLFMVLYTCSESVCMTAHI